MVSAPSPVSSPKRFIPRPRSMQALFSRRDLAAIAIGAVFTILALTAWTLANPAPGATVGGLPATWPPTAGEGGVPDNSGVEGAVVATAARDGGTAKAAGGKGATALAIANETTSAEGGDGSGGLWMTPEEATLIRSAMWKGMRYLEYGSGGSTLPFGRLASVGYSVEHDADWCRKMKPTLVGSPIRMVCAPVARAAAGSGGWGSRTPFDPADYATFRSYVRAPAALPPTAYDVVLVDGRARVACALFILRKLTRSSVVIIHDANRKRYIPVTRFYDEVARVTSGKGAVVLRPKRRWAGKALSDDQIKKVYAKIAKMRTSWKK